MPTRSNEKTVENTIEDTPPKDETQVVKDTNLKGEAKKNPKAKTTNQTPNEIEENSKANKDVKQDNDEVNSRMNRSFTSTQRLRTQRSFNRSTIENTNDVGQLKLENDRL